jgi:serine/threonine protein kinase
MGTRVLLKAYPAMTTRGTDADVMAANELRSHVILQDASQGECSENIIYLYGGFQTRAGEQWLVFRDDGRITAADYAKEAAQATAEGRAVGEWEFWDRFDKSRPIQRRRHFITKLLRGTFKGLAFMHAHDRLHQSLGPASVVINTKEERGVGYLIPRLRDLAFSTDVSDQAILGGSTIEEMWERRTSVLGSEARDSTLDRTVSALSEGLWRRAAMAGARMAMERKAFGIADDM